MNRQTFSERRQSKTALVWQACGCGMSLRIQLPEQDAQLTAEMRGLIMQAMEEHVPSGEAPEHTCLVLRNAPGATAAYLDRYGEEGARSSAPLALFVGGTALDAGFPSRMAWVPENCDPWVLAWMLDHLSANAWKWSGRNERRREPRSRRPVHLTPQLRLVDISVDGCQLESCEPFSQHGNYRVPLHPILPGVELQLKIVRTRSTEDGRVFRAHGYFTGFPAGLREVVQDALRAWIQRPA